MRRRMRVGMHVRHTPGRHGRVRTHVDRHTLLGGVLGRGRHVRVALGVGLVHGRLPRFVALITRGILHTGRRSHVMLRRARVALAWLERGRDGWRAVAHLAVRLELLTQLVHIVHRVRNNAQLLQHHVRVQALLELLVAWRDAAGARLTLEHVPGFLAAGRHRVLQTHKPVVDFLPAAPLDHRVISLAVQHTRRAPTRLGRRWWGGWRGVFTLVSMLARRAARAAAAVHSSVHHGVEPWRAPRGRLI